MERFVLHNKKNTLKRILRQVYFVISLIIAYGSAVWLWYFNVGVHWKKGFTGTRTLFIVGVLFSFTYWFFAKMYNAHKIGLYRLVELSFSQSLAFGITDVCLFGASFIWFHNLKKLHVSYFIFAFFVQVFLISVVIFVCNRFFCKLDEPRKISIIYGNDGYKSLVKKMKKFKYRYEILSCLPDTCDFDEINRAVQRSEDVYLYEVNASCKDKVILLCDKRNIELHITLTIQEIIARSYDISHSYDTPFMRNRKSAVHWYYPIVKRCFDIVVSLLVLILFSPVFFVTAIAIKAYDGGPVFYKQTRMTTGGALFYIYKFRSMIPDAEKGKARLASKNDDRITPVGHFIRKTRIDELPQMLNILKGDMSFVGPRPERPEIAKQYEKELPEFHLRLRVKAGLTGYAQVYGKYNTTPLDKLKLDLIYITNQSILMDLKILFYTVKIIFIPDSTEGIEEGKTTAQK